ncbi:MAG TPA: histidine kinase [Cyclobacteriaceae bacterium]|jgi:LytS/YehU family sensor histidine kinase|nr:histidine kinase [Cyclobacteriaceae bacterium]
MRYRHYPNWKRLIVSFGINSFFQVLFMSIPQLFRSENPFPHEQYVFYPILTFIGFNAIILLLCNSTLVADNKASADIEIQKLKFQNSEAQKKILQQQLHPHFLFNALSVLKSLIREDPREAGLYAVKLSDFLRYSVKAPTQITVPLHEELEFTIGYIELQKARFENSFSCNIDVPLSANDLKIPVYALQTLVENAFKHNYFSEKNPMHLDILYQNRKLKVTNNKVSLKITERSGTGLSNLNERHRIITGNEIIVEEDDLTFSVTLQLLPA